MREHDRLLEEPLPPTYETTPDSSHRSSEQNSLDDGGREPTKSTGYLILLTIAIGGLQMAWCVELSSISPFLLSLGLSKSMLALVWIAGPLSGTLVQPYVGIRSDNCRSRFGRRRPFIIGGAVATIVSLLALAWTREIVAGVLSIFGVAKDSYGTTIASQIFAVAFVYILDFAINVIQGSIRAFIVDCAPTHQQEQANAWASRITGVGNILGYSSGYVHLVKYLPFLGNTQFKILIAIACIGLAITVSLSTSTIRERDPRSLDAPADVDGGVVSFFKTLYRSMRRLPKQIRRVCQVQIFAWIGWFPFLFYITTYIGGIYAEPFFEENPNLTEAEINVIMERGTRVGTFALLVFAITTFSSSVILPFIVAPSYRPYEAPVLRPHTPLAPLTPSGALLASEAGGDYFQSKATPLHPQRGHLTRYLPRNIQIPGFTLRRAWLLSHLFFAIVMWCTFLVRNTTTATILVGLIGIPWSLTNWAPFALIAGEISKRDAIRRRLRPPPMNDEEPYDDGPADQAGVVLGIHNVSIAAPQVLASLVSSLVFRAMQKPRGVPGDNSVGWVLRFGGVCALLAAWITTRVGDGDDEDKVSRKEREGDEEEGEG